MSWAKLDDRANEHRKQLAAGAEACWLWACGLMYANRQRERDGFIPDAVLGMLYPMKSPKRLAEKLVGVGLWERVDGGYRIHDFHDWNQTKEEREAELAAARVRAAKSYERRHPKNRTSSPEESPQSSPEESPQKQNSSGSTPTPLRDPDPKPTNTNQGLVRSHALGPPSGVVAVVVDYTDSDQFSPCPPDLHERAERLGIIGELAGALKVSPDSLLEEAREYVAHFTLTRPNERRNHWMTHLRRRLVKRAKAGELKSPGLIEHEATKAKTNGLPPGWTRHRDLPGYYLDENGMTRTKLPEAS